MADNYRNQFARGLRGAFGDQLVVHQTGSGKTIVAARPLLDDSRGYLESLKTRQASILDATTFATFAKTQNIYINREQVTGVSAYQLAVADWFAAPRVLEIDVDRWTGKPGETIRVKARDNVGVARVTVVIRDAEGNVLEMGEAVQSEEGSAWWNYTSQSAVALTPFPSLQAIAFDLPGNRDSFIIS